LAKMCTKFSGLLFWGPPCILDSADHALFRVIARNPIPIHYFTAQENCLQYLRKLSGGLIIHSVCPSLICAKTSSSACYTLMFILICLFCSFASITFQLCATYRCLLTDILCVFMCHCNIIAFSQWL